MADEKDSAGGAKGKKSAKVIAKQGMWRGGLKWEAGLNEIEASVLDGKVGDTKQTVREALEADQGGNFTIL